MPVQLAARLRRSHLLFLGYSVDDWSLRVFLRRVWGGDRLAYRSWAVQPHRSTLRVSCGMSEARRCTTSRSGHMPRSSRGSRLRSPQKDAA